MLGGNLTFCMGAGGMSNITDENWHRFSIRVYWDKFVKIMDWECESLMCLEWTIFLSHCWFTYVSPNRYENVNLSKTMLLFLSICWFWWCVNSFKCQYIFFNYFVVVSFTSILLLLIDLLIYSVNLVILSFIIYFFVIYLFIY